MGRNGTEVLGKVFLAILVLFASFLKAQHSSTCEFLLLDGVLSMVLLWEEMVKQGTRGFNLILRQERKLEKLARH
jgi:hypothetical protein